MINKKHAFYALDWRAFEGARLSGISYLIRGKYSGTITDPAALRTFYTRVFYGKEITQKALKGKGPWWITRFRREARQAEQRRMGPDHLRPEA